MLDIAGEGDHRPELEAEIESRGLGDRVRMHGHVDEERKRELLQRSWVNLTASSAEGWCLTVMEAGSCATPTAAIAVGGLPEAIEHERTGLLAADGEELTAHARRLVEDTELRRRLGQGARERSREFTWEGTAKANLADLQDEVEVSADRPPLRSQLAGSDTGRAAGLAFALMTNNFIALIFTVAFARLLGASGYGSLGALIAAFTILVVPGSALQATVAREVSAAAVTPGANPAAGVARWLRTLLIFTVLLVAVAVLLREPTRRGDRRGPRLGGRRDHPHRWALADALRPARCAPGAPALPLRWLQHRRRGGRAARPRAGALRDRAGRDGRVPRHHRLDRRDGARLGAAAAAGAGGVRRVAPRPGRSGTSATCSSAPGCRSWRSR